MNETMTDVEWIEHPASTDGDPLTGVHTLGWKFYVTREGEIRPLDGIGAWMVVPDNVRPYVVHMILEGELTIARNQVCNDQLSHLLNTWKSDDDDPVRRTLMSRHALSIADAIKQKIDARL